MSKNRPPDKASPAAAPDQRRRIPALPTLTHLQFLVLDHIRKAGGEVAAQEMMGALQVAGVEHRGPKFYQLMGRLEQSGMVCLEQKTLEVAGGTVVRTYYSVTREGNCACNVTADFYATRARIKGILQNDNSERPNT